MASSSGEGESMPAPRLTTNEYARTPETLLPQELVYGLLRDAPAPAPGHQSAVLRFLIALVEHVEPRRLGRVWPSPIDVVLDRDRGLVVQPDVIVVSNERLGIVTDRVWGAPDVVIEVLSPEPRIGRLDERIGWFAQYGVRECWLLHQEDRALELLQFEGGVLVNRRWFRAETPVTSRVLPDFNLSLEQILNPRDRS